MDLPKEQLDIMIKELKIKFGEVFSMEIEDDFFLFRLLTRQEYKEILMIAEDKDQIEEIVCQLAVVYPQKLNFGGIAAGIPSLLAPNIVNESGFGNLVKSHYYFNLYRGRMSHFEMQAEAAIQAAFPQVTEEEMQSWTVEKLMRTLAKAEWILKNVKGYPIEFQMVEEEEDGEFVEEEPPTMKEIGNELRQQGLDPMIELQAQIIEPRPFAEFPFIAGTEYWKKVY